jgi:regulatory protein
MKLRRHLASKNRMAIEFHAMPEDELLAMIDVEIDRLVAAGIVNDQEYATSKARSMARQGKSALQIDVKLHALGFDDDQSEQAARHLRDEEGHSERLAAARYIRKRRFGPFRPAETRHERRPAELASLVRNGFAYHLADSLLDQDRDYLETVIYGPQDGEC